MEDKKDHRFIKKNKSWFKKTEVTNSDRNKPTFNFRSSYLNPDIIQYLLRLRDQNELSKFLCQSVNRNFKLKFGFNNNWEKELFFTQLIKDNYSLCKHILRKEGRRRKQLINNSVED